MNELPAAGPSSPNSPLAKIETAIEAMKAAGCPAGCENQERIIRLYEGLADRLRADGPDAKSDSILEMLMLAGLIDGPLD